MYEFGIEVSILLFIGLFLDISFKSYERKKLFEDISWCIVKESNLRGKSRHSSLYSVVFNFFEGVDYGIKIEDFIPLELQLDGCDNERTVIINILDAYQSDLSTLYFRNTLNFDRIIASFGQSEYFAFSLFWFLYKNSDSKDFNNMQIFDDNNKFTEFGFIYYKLYYLTAVVCEKNKRISKKNGTGDYSERIMKTIKDSIV